MDKACGDLVWDVDESEASRQARKDAELTVSGGRGNGVWRFEVGACARSRESIRLGHRILWRCACRPTSWLRSTASVSATPFVPMDTAAARAASRCGAGRSQGATTSSSTPQGRRGISIAPDSKRSSGRGREGDGHRYLVAVSPAGFCTRGVSAHVV
jgi:hypothetical protein